MTGQEIIEKCREIVAECQADSIDGVLMDSFTASAAVQVYDALNDENKAKIERLFERDIVRATDAVWSVINKAKAS